MSTVRRTLAPARANRAMVLRLLRRRRRLSRAEVASLSGLSEASASRIIGELIEQRLVSEQGPARSTGGRPAAPLQLDDASLLSIGVDVHNWETRISVGTLAGRLLETVHFLTPAEPQEALDVLCRRVRAIRKRMKDREFEGIGIGARGIVNSRDGVIERGNNPAWTRVPVRDYLESRLKMPVFVENNVRAAAFAEYHYGSPDVQDAHCLLMMKVDEGIGIGMIVDGELYYGQHMAAGEFGQMVIADLDGDARHERPGCLEKLASDAATCERYRLLNGNRKCPRAGDVTAGVRRICHLALTGAPEAAKALRESARYLGIGISNVVWGLDPDAVILDGAITEAWPLVGPIITDQFADGREFLNFKNLILRPSTLRGQAVIRGAAALPFQSLFNAAEHARMVSADAGG
ncbi:MAG: ROK family protein [Bryobacteraceae bacterium]|nr:ROK family protein [Bryobacteraceae bacterium]